MGTRATVSTRRIVVVGGINVDTSYFVDALPCEGETIFSDKQELALGGKGLNQALAARRAGVGVELAGAVGADEDGKRVRRFLAEEDIGTQMLIESSRYATGRAVITVDANANNMIVVASGANASLSVSDIDRISTTWDGSTYLVANGESPSDTVQSAFERARKLGVITVWNPSPMPADPGELLKKTDVLVVNQAEAERLVGSHPTASATAAALYELGVEEVVLTLGKSGCIIVSADESFSLPTLAVDAVDPTAAGDTFLGYYIANRASGNSRDTSAATASVAAGLCVQTKGASTAIPGAEALTAEAVDQLMREK